MLCLPPILPEMSDQDAYMALALCNAQGELTALERGRYALGSVKNPEDLDVKAYAKSAGREKEQQTVYREVWAAEVAAAVNNVVNSNLSEHYMKLVDIHAAPKWLWLVVKV
jgi:hypothetical protein